MIAAAYTPTKTPPIAYNTAATNHRIFPPHFQSPSSHTLSQVLSLLPLSLKPIPNFRVTPFQTAVPQIFKVWITFTKIPFATSAV